MRELDPEKIKKMKEKLVEGNFDVIFVIVYYVLIVIYFELRM